jgi:flavin reductase (DIM6/NTAB) family NADH-FMN oxidoreductase RutF
MITILPKNIKQAQLHSYLLSAVAPRPICLASTIDSDGNANLSPFSFFNVFSSNPPIAIFSPARRGRDNTTKHTLDNVHEIKECVINIVNYDIVQQMSLSSCEYPKGVSEFTKSGLTPMESNIVKPFRVKESPVQMECVVKEVVALGSEGGAGNLVICEIVAIHLHENILNEQGNIDQQKIDLVGRLGADWYVRASGNALFEVAKPNIKLGIGYDALPNYIKRSKLLTGNDLGMLANIEAIPTTDEAKNFTETNLFAELKLHQATELQLFTAAKVVLNQNKVKEAWLILLQCQQ